MELAPLLQDLGLNQKEIDIYLVALPLGNQPASVIASKAKLNRVTTYIALKKLVTKGLASMVLKHNMHYFTVAQPKELLAFVRRKEKEWQHMYGELKEALASLPSASSPQISPLSVRSYQGLEGLSQVFQEALDGEHLFAYFAEQALTAHQKLPKQLLFPLLDRASSLCLVGDQELIQHTEDYSVRSAEQHLIIAPHFPLEVDLLIKDQRYITIIARHEHLPTAVVMDCPELARSMELFLSTSLSLRPTAQSSK